jgi:TPR repeat protein
MDDKPQAGLQHIPAGGGLALHPGGVSMVARARRDAANGASDPHYLRGVAEYNAGKFVEAAASFRRAAERGHVESQYVLSTMYEVGKGVEKADDEALFWVKKAAEQGHAYAQANLSYRHYAAGEFAEAFTWCQRAADSRLAWAQYNLGRMYRKGEGVAQSDAEAAYWYRLAAVQGHAEAQQKLGDLYSLGLGVARSYSEAAAWYRKAAEQGDAEAQFQLGHLYQHGLGIEQDYTEYRHWTREASMQGHEEAGREIKRREYRDA